MNSDDFIIKPTEDALFSDLDAWAARSSEDLIEYILTRYHRPLDEELPRLEFLAQKVARVHGEADQRLADIARLFSALKSELEHHFLKEEMILFPAILEGEAASLSCPVAVMLRDHENVDNTLVALRNLTDDYVAPLRSCGSWRALWRGFEALELSLREHMYLENTVLFPRIN